MSGTQIARIVTDRYHALSVHVTDWGVSVYAEYRVQNEWHVDQDAGIAVRSEHVRPLIDALTKAALLEGASREKDDG